ncbi:Protein of unknown function DUF1295 [Macrophomina phaseolina MS6]|uniref:N-acetyltransferase domain-containing protein n=1 Tax=Macrophomina phaseolina (strain MS6) TaxID=1126212 RepID=K2SEV3_MACPH|nr:Protein of unknown function DUF1295 [Macrophomina phaseolina MS6]
MPLLLSRASEEDMRQLVDLHYKVIQGPISDILIGYDTEECRQAAVHRWSQAMRHDPADLWLKVVDTETGRIVSTAHWKLYPTWVPFNTELPSLSWFPEGEERTLAEEIIHTFYANRAQRQHGTPHVLLNRLYTDQEYQRRGCGAMLVRMGCDIADQMFVPAWVESSPIGQHLYSSFGFKEVARPEIKNRKYNLTGPVMRREARGPATVNPRA